LQTLTSSIAARGKCLSQSSELDTAPSHDCSGPRRESSCREAESVSSNRASQGDARGWPPIVFRASFGHEAPGFHLCVPNQPPLVVSYQQLAELVRTATPWLALLKNEFEDKGHL